MHEEKEGGRKGGGGERERERGKRQGRKTAKRRKKQLTSNFCLFMVSCTPSTTMRGALSFVSLARELTANDLGRLLLKK